MTPRPARLRGGAAARPSREWLGGVHPVREALRAGRRRLLRLVLREGAQRRAPLREILALAAQHGLAAEIRAGEDFERLAHAAPYPQGVLLEAGPLPMLALEQLAGAGSSPRTLVVLDGVEDPQNLGAIARVAAAAGAAGLVLPERRSAPPSPAASRASAGALEWLALARVTNLARALRTLQERGYWVFAADAGGEVDLFEAPARLFEGDRVLVLGSEGGGVRRRLREIADHRVRIPMAGRLGSLNVATAAAVILFEWRRRERGPAGAEGSGRGSASEERQSALAPARGPKREGV